MTADQAVTSLRFMQDRLPVIHLHSTQSWPTGYARTIVKMLDNNIHHCLAIVDAVSIHDDVKEQAKILIARYQDTILELIKANPSIMHLNEQ